MAEVTIVDAGPLEQRSLYPAAACTADGAIRARLVAPEGYRLWAVEAEAPAGATLTWEADHRDEALYLVHGEIDIGGERCRAGGVAVVEEGVAVSMTVVTDARWVHFGSMVGQEPGSLGPAAPSGHRVHVESLEQCRVLPSSGTFYYADSTCPTCRVALLRSRRGPHRAPSHSHSQDEIIYVLAGAIRLGRDVLGPGAAVAIPANRRYSFISDEGYEFLNFRANVSEYSGRPGVPPVLETVVTLNAAGM